MSITKMRLSKGRNRARDFDELVDSAPQDFDPENDAPDSQGEGSESVDEDDVGDSGARHHYESVGSGRLRRAQEAALGPQYRGSRISRDAAEEADENDDPFDKGFDDDEDQDEAPGRSTDSGTSEEDDDETDDTGVSEDEHHNGSTMDKTVEDRDELKRIMAAEQKAVASSVSAATKADAVKGHAVRKQRATFESLLKTRITLQKSVIATNSLVAATSPALQIEKSDAQETMKEAEAAAFNLWSSLTALRDEMISARSGEKRKRPAFIPASPPEDLWKYLCEQEEDARPQRAAILHKWSLKARGVSTLSQRSKLNTEQPATIMDVLNEHLSNSDRLLKRARTPRSCAPIQLANRVVQDDKIYDDADFYGLLLKDLLEAKSSAEAAAAANIDLNSFAGVRREAKTRRNVDTKASKGRKLKYTVHEKLQNFCAPDDRTTWGQRQADELFASLFGQRMGLVEDGDADNGVLSEDEVDERQAGLMLLRG